MHFNLGRTVALVLASTAVAWPVPTSTSQAAGASGQTDQAPQMTLLGCLRGATNPTMEIKGTIYTLEVIAKSTGTPGPTVATPGAGDQAVAAKTPTRYTLVADESVGLTKHIDHRVEITGRLKAVSAPLSASTPERGQSQGKQQAPSLGGAHNTFEVSALKMVSASCP